MIQEENQLFWELQEENRLFWESGEGEKDTSVEAFCNETKMMRQEMMAEFKEALVEALRQELPHEEHLVVWQGAPELPMERSPLPPT